MSKLTDHQILAMIKGLELTATAAFENDQPAKARKAANRAADYRKELENRADARFQKPQVIDSKQNQGEQTVRVARFSGTMDQKTNSLELAGDNVNDHGDKLFDLGQWVGRHQAFAMLSAKCSAADAQCLKRIKDGGEYKEFGLTWEQFCDRNLGINRTTAERIIANYEEFGAAYFALCSVTRISSSNFRMIAGSVSDTEIEIDGQKIQITKGNAQQVVAAVAELRKQNEHKDEQLQEKSRDQKKLIDEKNALKKAVERERAALIDYKKKDEQLWPNASPERSLMLSVQSKHETLMQQLTNVAKHELNEVEQGALIGLCDYLMADLAQVSQHIRDEYGIGFNAPQPGGDLAIEMNFPDPRNLIGEWTKQQLENKAK